MGIDLLIKFMVSTVFFMISERKLITDLQKIEKVCFC